MSGQFLNLGLDNVSDGVCFVNRDEWRLLSGCNGEIESSTALAAPCQSVRNSNSNITDREWKGDQ